MRRTNNPFEDLHLTVNRKAVFEQYSDLGNKISSSKRIAILAQIVCAGYDMNKVVKRYLKDKVALKPLQFWRISEIEETFNQATFSILSDDLEKRNETKDYAVSDSIKVLFKKHFKHSDWKKSAAELLTKETSLTTLQIAIDEFAIAVKELYPKEIFTPTKIKVEPTYNIRQLLKAYLKKDQTEYQQISKALGIDLDKDFDSQSFIYKLRARDEDEHVMLGGRVIHQYCHLLNRTKEIIEDLKKGESHGMVPVMGMSPIEEALIKKYRPDDQDDVRKFKRLLRKCTLDLVEAAIAILWLNKSPFEDPVYMVCCHFEDLITIRATNKVEVDFFDALMAGKKETPYNEKLRNIARFVEIIKHLKTTDVLVILSYNGRNPHIVRLPKGTKVENNRYFQRRLDHHGCDLDVNAYPQLKIRIPPPEEPTKETSILEVRTRPDIIRNLYYRYNPWKFKSYENHAKAYSRISPQQITILSENEIFVFGSNLAGHHGGGAARLAMDWGAIWGQGVGLQGQTYAIPTMFDSVEKIKPYVDEFLAFAKEHSELEFLVTEIGCGIAGWTVEDIAPLFCEAGNVENVYLPERFWQELTDSKPQVPIEKSYMVEEKRLYAGEYPRDKEVAASIEKVSAFVAFGITDFIDLTDKEDNLLPYKQLLPADAGYYNFPILDQHTPQSPAYMDSIVTKIDELIGMGRKVYVHCWGGVGRTGMVIACWLGHKGLTEKETFAAFQKLRKHYPKLHSPLCVEQEEFIKQYILRDRQILE